MLARVPTRLFSLDPLIQEAKRRARQRRVLIAVGVALVAGAAAGAVLAARSPGGPGSGSGGGPGSGSGGALGSGSSGGPGSGTGGLASIQASFRGDPTQAPVTAASIAAAHRDGARMLRLFVPPPGARRIAYEPAFYQPQAKQILGRNTWGLGPALSDKFARFAYWRVPASVAAVASFERAHRPAGSPNSRWLWREHQDEDSPTWNLRHHLRPDPEARHQSLDAGLDPPAAQSPDGDPCGREQRSLEPKELPRSAAGSASLSHRHPPGPSRGAKVHRGRGHRRQSTHRPSSRAWPADGVLENHPLPAVQHVSAIAPPAGWPADLARLERVSKVEAVTCTWQIPANAAGQQLRLAQPRRRDRCGRLHRQHPDAPRRGDLHVAPLDRATVDPPRNSPPAMTNRRCQKAVLARSADGRGEAPRSAAAAPHLGGTGADRGRSGRRIVCVSLVGWPWRRQQHRRWSSLGERGLGRGEGAGVVPCGRSCSLCGTIAGSRSATSR